ncbi:accessory Sec system S-layer assembly protein [Bacillus sp. EAC]|uniref:accessory Sec system S-layer assembly protein n=1 Tax=Bacillus sp. EAC TaxID=1978338 RepID=UPI000B45036A|nr:accessory Sec system S-layer assembly protein [Bacillus sp. EAC]
MFSSIKRFLQKGKDSTVSSNDLLQQASTEETVQTEEVEVKEVYPKISFHPLMHIEDESRYVYQFLNNELPPLLPNQLSLSAIDIEVDEEGAMVTAFVRNSLEKSVLLEDVVLLLISEERELLARKEFSLEDLGELPACSSRPWRFYFEREFLTKEELPATGFQLAFDLSKNEHKLDLNPEWEEQLTEEQKEELRKLVSTLPKLGPNEISLHAVSARSRDDGNLSATLLIRNGSKQAVNLEQLPLEVIDENGELIARGSFTLPPLTIHPNTSKPWTFIFPESLVENPTFNRFSVRVPNQEIM